jgi:uncharacterized protein YyaL (SSP411 family)
MFIELFEETSFLENRTVSEVLAKKLLEIPTFKTMGIFPSFVSSSWGSLLALHPQYKKRFRETMFIKSNANALHGLLSLYQKNNDPKLKAAIEHWFAGVTKHFIDHDGFVIHTAEIEEGRLTKTVTGSASNHTAIDLFSDLANHFKEARYLDAAEHTARAWLSIQGTTGLFPLSPTNRTSDLDSQTDMIVALWKLHELSGKEEYRAAADRALEGVLTHHKQPGGYVLGVNVDSGTIVSAWYKTKFIALFLKALHLYIDGRKIYQNEELFELLKDR